MDINPTEIYKENGLDIKYIIADARKLPFKKNMFDAALCIDVIEHIDNDKQVISEISRVLKRNGQLVISVPNQDFPLTYDPVNYILKSFNKHIPIGIWGFGHKRIYSQHNFKRLLEDNGFKIAKSKRLTHNFAGLFENYISDVLQPITKKGKNNICAPAILHKLVKLIVKLDEKFGGKKSVGIIICARKI